MAVSSYVDRISHGLFVNMAHVGRCGIVDYLNFLLCGRSYQPDGTAIIQSVWACSENIHKEGDRCRLSESDEQMAR